MLGDFAASEDVVDLGYGWTFFAPISCAFVMVRSVRIGNLHCGSHFSCNSVAWHCIAYLGKVNRMEYNKYVTFD